MAFGVVFDLVVRDHDENNVLCQLLKPEEKV